LDEPGIASYLARTLSIVEGPAALGDESGPFTGFDRSFPNAATVLVL
jgi:hypothetical protein